VRDPIVQGALLRGCLAAIAVIGTLAAPSMVMFVASQGGLKGPGHVALLVVIDYAVTGAAMIPRLLVTLLPATLAARRYNGGLGGVLAIGALAGALLELALAAATAGIATPGIGLTGSLGPTLVAMLAPDMVVTDAAPNALTIGLMAGSVAVVPALAGAVFAWPVWHRCVAPRRQARAAAAAAPAD
jgi:hypothetical protein